MQTIAHIHRDATIIWDEIVDPADRLLEDSGDIVLNLLDVWNRRSFYIDDALERWAAAWGFSLAGISVPDAVHRMRVAFVFPTLVREDRRARVRRAKCHLLDPQCDERQDGQCENDDSATRMRRSAVDGLRVRPKTDGERRQR